MFSKTDRCGKKEQQGIPSPSAHQRRDITIIIMLLFQCDSTASETVRGTYVVTLSSTVLCRTPMST